MTRLQNLGHTSRMVRCANQIVTLRRIHGYRRDGGRFICNNGGWRQCFPAALRRAGSSHLGGTRVDRLSNWRAPDDPARYAVHKLVLPTRREVSSASPAAPATLTGFTPGVGSPASVLSWRDLVCHGTPLFITGPAGAGTFCAGPAGGKEATSGLFHRHTSDWRGDSAPVPAQRRRLARATPDPRTTGSGVFDGLGDQGRLTLRADWACFMKNWRCDNREGHFTAPRYRSPRVPHFSPMTGAVPHKVGAGYSTTPSGRAG